ncbi:MAG: hydrolase [Candidatus Thiodiazotropha sp. (ex Semelilucina semeliformis)]|nr:hydrolase [Candidatus Thiodiazotropha sp. (ex Myrtea spinifera)]MCU7806689.1 hydrolase [Candidatus Thiodiazotropha sp. (ex Semelilucina semeliformis)]MCU7811619.1 hydrolase [Candidatus Thiodiazotropha sp. (ex Notomyrtea botanica)]MCU7829037.1 hydrolase [Candidatus Thiodiazotropha sp. (ex Myrtea sp. 'scaly one' KF741663)]MCU7851147.1 hydrolase [Candidatus Thiodiazotropha sp. (ex Monitilora ramsayi)]
MAINSIMGPSLLGIQKGFQGMRRVASEIASTQQTQQAKPTDLSRAMVEMKVHANQTKASVKALQAADDVLGTLIDERA